MSSSPSRRSDRGRGRDRSRERHHTISSRRNYDDHSRSSKNTMSSLNQSCSDTKTEEDVLEDVGVKWTFIEAATIAVIAAIEDLDMDTILQAIQVGDPIDDTRVVQDPGPDQSSESMS